MTTVADVRTYFRSQASSGNRGVSVQALYRQFNDEEGNKSGVRQSPVLL
jgi:hypothetical protein